MQAYPTLNLAIDPKAMKYRFNWNAPILVSHHDPKTIFHAGNVLLKSTNGGINWEVISPDLTRNDTTKQGPGGKPFTNEGAGGENYNTIFYVAESKLDKEEIWTGSDCGLVQVTLNGGKTWNNVTPADLAESQINSMEVSAFEKGTVYVSATRYKFNDYNSYTYKTSDFGKTWTRINRGVKADDFIKVIREDTKNNNILYAGSERGFYLSSDAGNSWKPFQLNLPIVPVTDLMIRDNDLVASTAGRAFWILDDLSTLQQFAETTTAQTVRLIKPKASYKYGGGSGWQANHPRQGENAPEGVILDYFLPAVTEKDTLTLGVYDANGLLVRTYTNQKDTSYIKYPGGPSPTKMLSAEKGHNRFLWDIRTESVKPDVKNVFVYGDYRGYAVVPGNYKARLTLNNTSTETELTVLPNPTIQATENEWAEQQKILSVIVAAISEMQLAVNELRKVKKQLAHQTEIYKEVSNADTVVAEAKKLITAIDAWESIIVEGRIQNGQDVINWPSKLNAEFFNIKSLADASDPRITQGVKNRLADLLIQWAAEKTKLHTLKQSFNQYNTLFKEQQLDAIQF